MNDWRGAELDTVLPALEKAAREATQDLPEGTVGPVYPGGYSEEEIYRHGTTLGRSIPEPIRRLYRVVDGPTEDDQRFRAGTCLCPLRDTRWLDPDDHGTLIDLDTDWKRNDYFLLVDSGYGAHIVYCVAPPGRPPGAIILIDHDMISSIPDSRNPVLYTPIVFLGGNLAEWLARWIAYGFMEYALFPGELAQCDSGLARAYMRDHLRLNPRSKWAAEWLAKHGK